MNLASDKAQKPSCQLQDKADGASYNQAKESPLFSMCLLNLTSPGLQSLFD